VNKSAGFTLIEVLITTFIFSFAILSLTQLQTFSGRYGHSANLHSIASLAASSLLEQMRTDREAVLAGGYNIDQNSTLSSTSNPANIALQQWRTQLTANLPEGQGSIRCDNTHYCTVSIFWRNTINTDISLLSFSLSSQF
jgi:type IV pilus assembly protein PilV